ncbi:hypothetical protein SCAR479_05399 [Seiridium cardinale]|uniref:Cyanovirin-N domain-containing protein n=1 Tax=Seiridium cardinale TaxID=138064 RepID=A0ABR2XW80_9PEZI
MLVLILYYNNTGGDTPFERLMDSESFGVKFLLTGGGVIITFFWSSFFSSESSALQSTNESHHVKIHEASRLCRRTTFSPFVQKVPDTPSLLSPPANPFSGVVSGCRRRHTFLALVDLTAVLSEFLTMFLSNIPFRVTQTCLVARICTWSAVGILVIMIAVVIGNFFVKWPHMSIDPSTIAGRCIIRESNFNASCTWFIADNFTLTGSCTGLEVHPGRVWQRDSELDLNKCIAYAGNGKLTWKENGNYWAGIVNEPMAQASYGCKREWIPLGSLDMTCWIGGLSAKSFNINLSERVSNKNGTLSCFETEVVRDAQTGEHIVNLEQGQLEPLLRVGLQSPEIFVARGRDGKTSIHGIILRPTKFDTSKKYPITERIYAGPHDFHTPKTFRNFTKTRQYPDQGYVLVILDGTGTNWRSKASHDGC